MVISPGRSWELSDGSVLGWMVMYGARATLWDAGDASVM